MIFKTGSKVWGFHCEDFDELLNRRKSRRNNKSKTTNYVFYLFCSTQPTLKTLAR